MKLNVFFVIVCACLFIIGCNSNVSNFYHESFNVDTIKISKIKQNYDARDLFESPEVIALKFNGVDKISEVSEYVVTDSGFVVMDKNINKIFLFDLMGTFLKVLLPPEKETVKYYNLMYDDKGKHILFRDLSNSQILIYDIKGNFIKKISTEFDYLYSEPFNSRLVILNNYPEKKSSAKNEVGFLLESRNLDDSLSVVKSFFKYDSQAIYKSDLYDLRKSFYKSKDGKSLYFTRFGELAYYNVNDSSILNKTLFQIDENYFPSVPNDFLTNKDFYGKRMQYLNNYKEKLSFIDNICETNNGILINIMSLKGKFMIIKVDSSIIPVGNLSYTSDLFGGIPFISYNTISDNTSFYSFFSSNHLFSLLNQLPYYGEMIAKGDKNLSIIEKYNSNSNGFILKYNLKPHYKTKF
ncbi:MULTISPECIES: hypothetical protein [unclassified Sphingobacterium]|uniref:hypothetical protein n=1 Tax=unclassified Sphingobacterium TaxID=2609468 RepID=UPI00104A468F|nr:MULTISPECIES: hypothetical protein [unclassified Sphingobacterium]MCS3554730.1 hypothetical protein [Sphingobacterium sp. JUb21]TCR07717.1 hypothetical protein EDF66_105350 [Sphingobacterium sp. JUb20]